MSKSLNARLDVPVHSDVFAVEVVKSTREMGYFFSKNPKHYSFFSKRTLGLRKVSSQRPPALRFSSTLGTRIASSQRTQGTRMVFFSKAPGSQMVYCQRNRLGSQMVFLKEKTELGTQIVYSQRILGIRMVSPQRPLDTRKVSSQRIQGTQMIRPQRPSGTLMK